MFDRPNPGFDAMVGNPPFAGKNTTVHANRPAFLDWLKVVHAESHGNADLVAHFYRRAFNLLREHGTFGLIATNTIGQGDTRGTGLRWICTRGGNVYAATRRVKWPGLAAVVVSVVHVHRGDWAGMRVLDGRLVDRITAFLFHAGGDENPATLRTNAAKSFQGSIVLGMGFTFDDTNPAATPVSEMRTLVTRNPKNAERIFPFVSGEEVSGSARHASQRFVINFGDMPLHEAERWPDLLSIVEAKVRPERTRQNDPGAKEKWWQYIRPRPELHAAIAHLTEVLVNPLYGAHLSFAFLPARTVFANKLNVLTFALKADFALLQARPHEVWARNFSSTLKDDLAYAPSDCFETFPFPPNWQTDPTLEAVGKTYYDFRAALMIRNNEGLTKTYNRFHDPDEHDPEIETLRKLHAAMDRAVLDAYGWTDIPTDCEFLLDYEIDEATWGEKKKPYRYRWPDAVRDEVLARLLDLNQKRYQEEVAAGLHATGKDKVGAKGAAAVVKPATAVVKKAKPDAGRGGGSQGSLF